MGVCKDKKMFIYAYSVFCTMSYFKHNDSIKIVKEIVKKYYIIKLFYISLLIIK